jgi:hypothetical protein
LLGWREGWERGVVAGAQGFAVPARESGVVVSLRTYAAALAAASFEALEIS